MRKSILGLSSTLQETGLDSAVADIVAAAAITVLSIVTIYVIVLAVQVVAQYIISGILPRTNIYVDLDGTIAAWIVGGDFRKEGYFINLPEVETMVLVVKALRRDPHFKVRFLTAVNDEWAKEEKSNWLHDRFWFLREKDIIFVPYGKNKSDYIPDPKPSDILLDDHTPNCVAWSGKAIKVVNDINNKNGTWQGEKVYTDDSPRYIVSRIRKIDHPAA